MGNIITEKIDEETIINKVLSGCTFDEITVYHEKNLEEWPHCILWDMNEVEILEKNDSKDFSFKIWRGKEKWSNYRKTRLIAMFANEPAKFGMLRALETINTANTEVSLKAFRNIEEAKKWLNEQRKEQTYV